MATADLITAFLSNEMSPDRERQFLLSVAASDALRLELKSHLMLDRMMGERAQNARVPDAVRMAIFAQAGIATASAPSADAATHASNAGRAAMHATGFFSRLAGRMTLFAATLAVFGAGYATGVGTEDVPTSATKSGSAVTSPVNGGLTAPGTVDAAVDGNGSAANGVDTRTTSRANGSAPAQGRSIDPSNATTAPGQTLDAGSPRVSSSAATAPMIDAAEKRRLDIERQRNSRQGASVTVDGGIRHPTADEKAKEMNPLDPEPK